MAAVIEVKDLDFRYSDGTCALNDMNLSVEQGTKVCLLGPNGAGKSTLLLHLNAINLPQKGQVAVFGQPVNRDNQYWVRNQVGMVFQDPDDQVFAPTVWEDVAFGPLNMGLPHPEVHRRVEEALRLVGVFELKDRPPHNLSYGQKKKVAIAGVLAMDPEVIILDEPTAYLDPLGIDSLIEILEALSQRGKTLIVATHDVDLAVEWAEQLIIIKDGKRLAQGGTELLTNADLVREAKLRFPVVTKIFAHFPELELTQVPTTIEDAVRIIQGLLSKG